VVGKCILLYRSDLLTTLLKAVSWAGDGVWIPVAMVIIAAFLIFWFKKDKVFAITLLLAPLLGNVVKYLLKTAYTVSRPGVFGCEVLTNFADKYAFPSGHTIFYTIFFGLLAYYSIKHWHELWAKILLPFSLILILFIGYSRIYLGAHWYLDVIAGYIIGWAIFVISTILYKYFSGEAK
jgi:membrane-associated phospholipid phosphatase